MQLTTVWFILIAVLWMGYFVLEGFDFGVGMLLPILGRKELDRRTMINTIGPVWDGNEVWVIVAGGATFAAFPEWYATLFSGFYLPLLLILLGLIIRGVAFEYRGKREGRGWRQRFDWCIIVGSFVPALLWGVAFANIVRGVPIDANKEFVGNLFDLLSPYALLGGVTTVTLFALHGALFIALKTEGDIRARANRLASRLGLVAVAVAVAFLAWTHFSYGTGLSGLVAAAAGLALVGAWIANQRGREGWAFIGTFVAIALTVASLFIALFPDVMPSSLRDAWSLTTHNASSTHYTLTIMTWAAAIFTPLVLLYQGWTYWVFRKRIGTRHIQ